MLLCHAPHLTLTLVTLAVTCRAGDAACHPPPSPSLPPLHLPLCLGLFLPRPNSSTPISPCRTQPEKFLCKTSLETLLSFPIAKSWGPACACGAPSADLHRFTLQSQPGSVALLPPEHSLGKFKPRAVPGYLGTAATCS